MFGVIYTKRANVGILMNERSPMAKEATVEKQLIKSYEFLAI